MEFAEPKIVEMAPKPLVVLARAFDISTRGDIPKLWQEYAARGIEVENTVRGAMWGVSFEVSGDGFRYGVGVEVSAPTKPPEGCSNIELVGGTYAVLSQRIPIARFPAMFDYLFKAWMPGSGYMPANGGRAERYPHDPDETPDAMTCELWVPVRRKM